MTPSMTRQTQGDKRRGIRHTTTVDLARDGDATRARERTRDGFVSRERARERRFAVQVRARRGGDDEWTF